MMDHPCSRPECNRRILAWDPHPDCVDHRPCSRESPCVQFCKFFSPSQWMAVEHGMPLHSPEETHGDNLVSDAWGSRGGRRSNAPATATSSGAPVPGESPVAQATGDKPEGVTSSEEGRPNPSEVTRDSSGVYSGAVPLAVSQQPDLARRDSGQQSHGPVHAGAALGRVATGSTGVPARVTMQASACRTPETSVGATQTVSAPTAVTTTVATAVSVGINPGSARVVTLAHTPRVACFEADYGVPSVGLAQARPGAALAYAGAAPAQAGEELGYMLPQHQQLAWPAAYAIGGSPIAVPGMHAQTSTTHMGQPVGTYPSGYPLGVQHYWPMWAGGADMYPPQPPPGLGHQLHTPVGHAWSGQNRQAGGPGLSIPSSQANLSGTTPPVRAVRPGTGGSGVAGSPVGDLAPLIGQLITALRGRDQADQDRAASQVALDETRSRPSAASAAAGPSQTDAVGGSDGAPLAAAARQEPSPSGTASTSQVAESVPESAPQLDSEEELLQSLHGDGYSSSEGSEVERASAAPEPKGLQAAREPDSEDKAEEGQDGLPSITPLVIDRIAGALGLSCEPEEKAEGEKFDLDLGFNFDPPARHRVCAMPKAASVFWHRSGLSPQKQSSWNVLSFNRSLRTTEEFYDSILRTPMIDGDVASRLPVGKSAKQYSPYWEEQLRLLDGGIAQGKRLASFAIMVAHDLNAQAKDGSSKEVQDDASVLGALVGRQAELFMALSRRLDFLRRENVCCSLRTTLNEELASSISKSKPESREGLFGGSFCDTLLASAEKVESEKTLKDAQARLKASKRRASRKQASQGLKRASPPSSNKQAKKQKRSKASSKSTPQAPPAASQRGGPGTASTSSRPAGGKSTARRGKKSS